MSRIDDLVKFNECYKFSYMLVSHALYQKQISITQESNEKIPSIWKLGTHPLLCYLCVLRANSFKNSHKKINMVDHCESSSMCFYLCFDMMNKASPPLLRFVCVLKQELWENLGIMCSSLDTCYVKVLLWMLWALCKQTIHYFFWIEEGRRERETCTSHSSKKKALKQDVVRRLLILWT